MNRFKYIGVTAADSSTIRGAIKATDANEAKSILRTQGIYVSHLEVADGRNMSMDDLQFRPHHISLKDQSWVLHKLASAVSTGIAIQPTLTLIAEQKPKTVVAKTAQDIGSRIGQGQSVGAAFEAHQEKFGDIIIAMIKVGASTGELHTAFANAAELVDDRRDLRQTIVMAITYPLISLFASFCVGLFVLLAVLPKFKPYFKQLGQKLPALTQFTMGISDILRAVFTSWDIIFGIITVVCMVLFWKWLKSTPKARRQLDNFFLHVPIFGSIFNYNILARVSNSLAMMIKSGLGVQEALDHAMSVSSNEIHREILRKTSDYIRAGLPLSRALLQAGPRYKELALAIQTGEDTGGIDEYLFRYGKETAATVRTMLKSLTSVLEPILIVVNGGIVGTIVISAYLPEIGLIKGLQKQA